MDHDKDIQQAPQDEPGKPTAHKNRLIQKGKRKHEEDTVATMKVLGAQGGEETLELLGSKFSPYPKRGAQIENLCGMFGQRVEMGNLPGLIVDVSTPFGVQHELYHIDGNVTVNQGRGFFKACR